MEHSKLVPQKYLKILIPNLLFIVLVLFKYSKSFQTFLYLQGKPPSRGAFQPNVVCDAPPQTTTYLRTHTKIPKINWIPKFLTLTKSIAETLTHCGCSTQFP